MAKTVVNENLIIDSNKELELLTAEYRQYLSGKKKYEIISFKKFIENKKSLGN